MRGSIRTFTGLFIMIIAGSSFDNAPVDDLPLILLIAVVGGLIANSGVKAMKGLK